MANRLRERGFTLIEVSLAIVIGIMLLAGVVVLYNQVRESVASGKMQQKVMSAAMVIEEIVTQTGSYPNPTVVEDQNRVIVKFQRALPDDCTMSPWGGNVGPDALPSKGITPYWMQPVALSAIGGETQLAADGAQNLSGAVQYFALGTAGVLAPTATASYWDKTKKNYVTYKGYVVSGVNQNNMDGWGVYGPKP